MIFSLSVTYLVLALKHWDQSILEEGTPQIFESYVPKQLMFYCFSINKFSKIGALCPATFLNYPKFLKQILKFNELF